jgi:hypothetical protein
MKLSERLHIGSGRPAAETATPEAAAGSETLGIAGYDGLHEKDVIGRLHELSQVQLAEIEAYERSHLNRRVVLHKLRYMRSPEPVDGYDALEPAEIVRRLEAADTATIRAIRDYEGKFQRRRQVLGAAAQALPNAVTNPAEQDRRDEKAERTRTGIQDRRDLTG